MERSTARWDPKRWFADWQKRRHKREFERVRGILSEITYKPGYTWHLDQSEKRLHLKSFLWVIDREVQAIPHGPDVPPPTNPFHHVQLQSGLILRRWLPRHRIIREVLDHLESVETHETGEFFKYKGERIFDPHTPFENKKKWKRLKRESVREWKWWERFEWEGALYGYLGGSVFSAGMGLICHRFGFPWSAKEIFLGNLAGILLVSKWRWV